MLLNEIFADQPPKYDAEGNGITADKLHVHDDVVITGDVKYQGATGVIDSFGRDKRFVVVNLYNYGKHSFHSSDVEGNEYADSDEEEESLYTRDSDYRKYRDDDLRETQQDDGIFMGAKVYHKDHQYGEPAKVVGIVDDQRVRIVDDYGNRITVFINQLVPAEQGVAEGKSLKKKVKVVKGVHAGKLGWIREIKHGLYKGAPKSYFVDLDDGGQANNLPGTALRLVRDEQGVAEGWKEK